MVLRCPSWPGADPQAALPWCFFFFQIKAIFHYILTKYSCDLQVFPLNGVKIINHNSGRISSKASKTFTCTKDGRNIVSWKRPTGSRQPQDILKAQKREQPPGPAPPAGCSTYQQEGSTSQQQHCASCGNHGSWELLSSTRDFNEDKTE